MATLKVRRASDNEPKPTQTASKDWYVDAAGNLTNDSTEAAFHIATKGQEILPHIATKYGFENGTVPAKAAKQLAADVEAQEKEAAAERAAAEKAAAKGVVPTENKKK